VTTTFGTEGAEWHWQDGGVVKIAEKQAAVALHDLTGFDGRCDAILFSTDKDFTPPNDTDALAVFRRRLLGLPDEPTDAGPFDLVVVGGGMAGTCAAISAARLGLEVALIQNRPVLGGNNSSDVRVHLGGQIHQDPYPALGGVVRELDPGHGGNAQPAGNYDDLKKQRIAEAEQNLHLFLNTHAIAVEKQGDRIVAVVAQNVRDGRRMRFRAPLFADCTGDGSIGFRAGAEFRYGRESRQETGESLAPEQPDRQTMGASLMWYTKEVSTPTDFPECPWALQFNEENYQKATSGDWDWETGFARDQIDDFEQIRDHGLRAVYGNWAYQKNHAKYRKRYENLDLAWVAYIGGKRESRRLMGDVILRQQDVVQRREFPDASVTTTWTIDLHYPVQSDQFPGREFRSRAEHVRIQPYAIPYRCFYSRNVDNLFMAGRNVSVTHVALGTVRVMKTTGMMGEVVGMAAAVCKRHNAQPRDVYEKHLGELQELMTRGVGKLPLPGESKPPPWLEKAGPNLARSAEVSVSSNYPMASYSAGNINDGRVSYTDNSLRWVSDKQLPATVDLRWPTPRTISAVRIVTGQHGGSTPATPITDFVLQYDDGGPLREIPATRVTGNVMFDWHARFPAVQTRRVRLLVTASPGDLARIWELELYHLPAEP
jgi:hypothetical protein